MIELIDTYKKKLKVAQNFLEQLGEIEDRDARIRIVAEINCYRYFIVELERVKLEELDSKEELVFRETLKREVTVNEKEFVDGTDDQSVNYTNLNLWSN